MLFVFPTFFSKSLVSMGNYAANFSNYLIGINISFPTLFSLESADFSSKLAKITSPDVASFGEAASVSYPTYFKECTCIFMAGLMISLFYEI